MAGHVWETKALINLWGEESIQKELDGAKQTKGIYQTISMHLEDLGYKRTWLQCRKKMKTLVLNQHLSLMY